MVQKIYIQPNKTRILELDVMRIILMMFVIVGHARYLNFVPYDLVGGTGTTPPANPAYWGKILIYADRLAGFAYSFHMPLFFVLSGIVAFITREKSFVSFDRMVVSKFKRLIIPYMLWGVFWVIPLRIVAQVYNSVSINGAIMGLFTLTDSSHLWFIAALFGVFILFYPFWLLYKKTGSYVAVGIVAFIFAKMMDFVPLHFLNLDRVFSYLPYFAIGFTVGGLLYNENNDRKTEISIFGLLATSMCSFVLLILAQFRYNLNFIPLNVLTMGACIYSFSLLITRHTKLTENSAFDIINRNCMRIYLFHDPMNFPILFAAYKTGFLVYAWGCYLMYFLRTVGIAVTSIGLSVLIEKVKPHFLGELKNKVIPACSICLVFALAIIPTVIALNINQVENITDVNWTNGVLNNGAAIVIEDTSSNYHKYIEHTPSYLRLNGEKFAIAEVINDNNGHYRVLLDSHETALNFAYPAKFEIINE